MYSTKGLTAGSHWILAPAQEGSEDPEAQRNDVTCLNHTVGLQEAALGFELGSRGPQGFCLCHYRMLVVQRPVSGRPDSKPSPGNYSPRDLGHASSLA